MCSLIFHNSSKRNRRPSRHVRVAGTQCSPRPFATRGVTFQGQRAGFCDIAQRSCELTSIAISETAYRTITSTFSKSPRFSAAVIGDAHEEKKAAPVRGV